MKETNTKTIGSKQTQFKHEYHSNTPSFLTSKQSRRDMRYYQSSYQCSDKISLDLLESSHKILNLVKWYFYD